MKLSDNFTLREMTRSATAAARNIENMPGTEAMIALRNTAACLEVIRAHLSRIVGHAVPLNITSGFRSLALNRAIGSIDSSQHVLGEAVDFVAPEYGSPSHIVSAIVASHIQFDQLINESASNGSRWVHISFSPRNRMQVLDISPSGVRMFGG